VGVAVHLTELSERPGRELWITFHNVRVAEELKSVEPFQMTLTEAAQRIATTELSPSELLESVLARIADADGRVGAFVELMSDSARASAREADREIVRGRLRGPLHGIPVSVKDLYDIADVPTSAGSPVRAATVAECDSAVVERLRHAGAILVGKTRTHEFAFGYTTPGTRNPWNLGHIAGGSSGGSAAAVAARLCFMSMGTDTGGSIRQPAAHCGVVGFKPTYGRVSMRGVAPLAGSFDHAGPLARTVADVAVTMDAIAGYDARDPASAQVEIPDFTGALRSGLEQVTVGIPANLFFDGCHPEVEAAVRAAIDVLRVMGARLREVDVPLAKEITEAHLTMMMAEAAACHRVRLRDQPDRYTDKVRANFMLGLGVPAVDYLAAQRTRRAVIAGWLQAFTGIDALIAPTSSAPAAAVDAETITFPDGSEEALVPAYSRCAFPADFTGFPSLSVPCGFTGDGLPIGMQIIGRPFSDTTVLHIGNSYQSSVGWSRREPNLG